MYTASLYGCLAPFVSTVEPQTLLNKPVSLFGFGSGCAALFYTLRVKGDTSAIREKLDLISRPPQTKVVLPQEFVDALLVCLPFDVEFCLCLMAWLRQNPSTVNYTPEG
jgi:hydroxymethylglutaryl-CoA synthase